MTSSRDHAALVVARAYRWQRGLGAREVAHPRARMVVCTEAPDVWEANHVDSVTAVEPDDIAGLFAALEPAFAHTSWRVVHTDAFTPDRFLAALAFEGFTERPVVIQMNLDGDVRLRGAQIHLQPVTSDADWAALLELVVANHREGLTAGGLELTRDFSARMVGVYRARAPHVRFSLVMSEGAPVGFGSFALAPNAAGMIEDLFVLPAFRGRGLGTGMIAAFASRLRELGASPIFLGALADEAAKSLYFRLGFRPLSLSRTWVRQVTTI